MTLMHYIGGAEAAGTSGRAQDVFNPATGQPVTSVPLASADEVQAAVAAAKAALPGWSNTPAAKRAQVMFNFRDLIKANLDELARLISSQHGKTFDDAKGEVARGLEVVEFACGIPHVLKGEYSPQVAGGVDVYSLRQPVGVVAGITPFNFPAMVPMWMFPMALACGNTFILKPSERDPGAPMMLARLMSEAGAPDGVMNVVNGDKEAVDAITAFLADKNAQARSSFEEAGPELLTLARLEITNELSVSLLSTNCIENVFKNLRRHIGRVSRWRESTDQADRWLATGFILTQQGFHRIKGYSKLPDLVLALEPPSSVISDEKAA